MGLARGGKVAVNLNTFRVNSLTCNSKWNSMTTKEKLLKALEIEKKGNWNKAHEIVQVMHHPYAYWIHAYLHRKEPDLSNASYWYARAKKPMPDTGYGYDKEWQEIYDYIKKSEVKD